MDGFTETDSFDLARRMLLWTPIMAVERFYKRFFEDAKQKLPLETASGSQFRCFKVSCRNCASLHMKIIFEADSSGVRSASLYCPECKQRERLDIVETD